ncbi:MAG: aminotransferase class I/II-fold pyridoxal phosphate-dependent enzyme [Cyanobacteria bacterium P01_H01_bin.121]
MNPLIPAPLLQQLLQSSERQVAAFHTPGHKRGAGCLEQLKQAWGMDVLQADLPELVELDNLFAPTGVIHQAQVQAAETFGADRTWFTTNGSTAGVIAAILATCGPGDRILLPRNMHLSAISGLILSGAEPILITPPYDSDWDLVGTITPKTIATALAAYPDIKAVLIVSPTYHGICADTEAIASICHAHGIPLLVDEAHGAHFGFHPALPQRALALSADLSVQSTHKVLSALTQAAMVHVKGDRVNPDRLQQALQLIQSTSPSYLLLASLDAAQAQMAQDGERLMAETVSLAQSIRDRLQAIPDLSVFTQSVFAQSVLAQQDLKLELKKLSPDPTRITVRTTGLGITGFTADAQLDEQFGVVAELPSLQHLTFIVSLGNTKEDGDRLVAAWSHLAQQKTTPVEPALEQFKSLLQGTASANTIPGASTPVHSQLRITPRTAFFGNHQDVAIEAAIGQVSAATVCPYPPGIPVLLPGEEIRSEAIDWLMTLANAGSTITGITEPFGTLRIVRDNPASV